MDVLYQRIKEVRELRRMTQDELAKRVGYSGRSAINRVEKGLVDIPRDKIKAIAEALGVSEMYLLGYQEGISPEIAEIVELLKKAPPDEVELIKNLLLNFKGVKGADK